MNELIRNIVDCQFEKIVKKIDILEQKIDNLQNSIESKKSIDKKIDIHLETLNTFRTVNIETIQPPTNNT